MTGYTVGCGGGIAAFHIANWISTGRRLNNGKSVRFLIVLGFCLMMKGIKITANDRIHNNKNY